MPGKKKQRISDLDFDKIIRELKTKPLKLRLAKPRSFTKPVLQKIRAPNIPSYNLGYTTDSGRSNRIHHVYDSCGGEIRAFGNPNCVDLNEQHSLVTRPHCSICLRLVGKKATETLLKLSIPTAVGNDSETHCTVIHYLAKEAKVPRPGSPETSPGSINLQLNPDSLFEHSNLAIITDKAIIRKYVGDPVPNLAYVVIDTNSVGYSEINALYRHMQDVMFTDVNDLAIWVRTQLEEIGSPVTSGVVVEDSGGVGFNFACNYTFPSLHNPTQNYPVETPTRLGEAPLPQPVRLSDNICIETYRGNFVVIYAKEGGRFEFVILNPSKWTLDLVQTLAHYLSHSNLESGESIRSEVVRVARLLQKQTTFDSIAIVDRVWKVRVWRWQEESDDRPQKVRTGF